MGVTHEVDFEDGYVWAVGAGAIFQWPEEYGRNICVCVPIDGIAGLTEADIGERVLRLIPYALGAEVDDCAYQIIHAGGGGEDSLCCAPDSYLEQFVSLFESAPVGYASEAAERAYGIAVCELQKRADKRAEKAAKDARRTERESKRRDATHATLTRSDLSRRYPEALLALGRRDGFACRMCGSSGSDLQIDHVTPVSQGGTNDPANLQILCQSCNSSKGARTMAEWVGVRT